jgi:HEAT repeat protein
MRFVSNIKYFQKFHFLKVWTLLALAGLFPFPILHAESVVETISRALEDMQSDNAELRRGGVMLLGKYPGQPRVMDGLVAALDDPDTGVRRAAAVSIIENIGQVNTVQARRVLLSLSDPDKEVRVAIATWLPQVILRALRANPLNRNALVLGDELQAVQQPVLTALSDSEPLVRRKAVESLQYLMGPLPPERLIPLFEDPDPQVRLAAYPVIRNLLPAPLFAAAALDQWPEPDPQARLALAEAAATQPAAEMQPLLQKLAEDPDPAIRLMSATGLFILAPNDGLPAQLKDALENDQLDRTLALRLIQAIRSMNPDQRQPVIELLLQSAQPSVRGQAVGLWLQAFDTSPPTDKLCALLEDPEPEVRQQALRFLSTRPQLVEPGLVLGLPDNPYLDVRQRVLSLLRFLSEEQQMQVLLRLLLDTEPIIRTSALTGIAQRKAGNWQAIFRASLRDPSEVVQRTAANMLIRSLGAEGVEIAKAYAREHPDLEVSRFIQQELTRLPR